MTFQPVSRIYIISHLSIFKFISSYLNISVYPSSFSSSFPKSQVNSSAFLLGMSSCISYFPSLAPSVFPSELTSKLLPIWPSSLRKSWSFLSSLSYLFFIPTIKCFESIVNQSHPLVLYQHLLLNLFHFVLPPSLLRWNSSWGHQCFPNYRVLTGSFPHSLPAASSIGVRHSLSLPPDTALFWSPPVTSITLFPSLSPVPPFSPPS